MADQQEGQAQTEDDFQRLARRHSECLPAIDAFERHDEVQKQGAIEQHRAGQAVPDEIEAPAGGFHRLDGDQAERMVEEMRQDERTEDGPGDEVNSLASVGRNDRQATSPALPERRPAAVSKPSETALRP